MKKILIITILGVVYFNCKTIQLDRGWEFIYNNEYDNAVKHFTLVVSVNETSYAANFGLGMAYYFSNDYTKTIKYLEKANSIDSTKSEIKYYLGLCYETKKDYDNALKYYQCYKDETVDSKYKSDMEKRHFAVLKAKYQEEAKQVIAGEKSIKSDSLGNTLAVVSFQNRSGNKQYEPLERGFPTMFITDFSLVPSLNIVERLRLQAILDELELNKSSMIDSNTIQKAGKLLGAKQIIKGGFNISSDNKLSLDIITIDITTGLMSEPVNKIDELNNFYRMEKDLVLNMIDKLGIKISEEVRQKILTIPTESFFQFLDRMKTTTEMEKIELPTATNAIENTIDAKVGASPLSTMLSTIDLNTGSEKTERVDVPSRFLPDPPLPPK